MLGRELLASIHSLAPGTNVAAILRHAERFRILDPREPTLAEITPAGAAAAEDFGRHITGFDRVRIFHSPVKRCRQTAECIARGAAANGLATELAGPASVLGVDYILDQIETGRLSEVHGQHFVRLWFAGEIPAGLIHPTVRLATDLLDFLHARLSEPSAGGRRLDLHISHDWNIIVLRELLLQVRHEESGWLTFLDGLSLAASPAGLHSVYRARTAVHSRPWGFAAGD